MERREVLRAMAVLALTPRWVLAQSGQNPGAAPPLPAPVPWTLGLNPRTPLPHTTVADSMAQTVPSYFSDTEMATLTRLSDAFMPRGERPGALDAETPAFLDFLIGHSPAVRGTLYKNGLSWLDKQARLKFRKPFAAVSDNEADELLKPWLRSWMTDHPPTQTHADFVNIAHADIRTATTNSKQWLDSLDESSRDGHLQLYWSPIEPDVYAERPTSVHTRPTQTIAAPKATHEVRSYPR